MWAWLLQNSAPVVQGVITTVLGYIFVRILRSINASTQRTEEHAKETAETVSKLDRVSLTNHDSKLEQWQQDMALRVEAIADGKSDTLAWQANIDRRLTAIEQRVGTAERFMWELDAYAHGTGPVPIFSPEETFSTGTHALEGATRDQH